MVVVRKSQSEVHGEGAYVRSIAALVREGGPVLECVVNISEGRRRPVLDALTLAPGEALLDVHVDPHHHRSVFTMAGPEVEDAARRLVAEAVSRIDLGTHNGAHPRLGAADVVPFVALDGSGDDEAVRARDAFAYWAGSELSVPCFLYGPERSLPDIRRLAFRGLPPDTGPPQAHPSAGATAVGARPILVAFNVWLSDGAGAEVARRIAADLRRPELRALGLDLGGRCQVSCNLVDPFSLGPDAVFDAVERLAAEAGTAVAGAELVGLVPSAVLAAIPRRRWAQLDLDPSKTIEARLLQAGLGGRSRWGPGSGGRGRR